MRENLNSAVFSLKRSAIREFSRLAKETPGCISMTLGEPDFDTPEPVREAARRSISEGDTHYIANNGSAALLSRISQFEKEAHGLTYDPSEIIVTAGATEALFVALMGTLNPGDEVIIPTPAFVLYEEIVKLLRGVPVFLDTAPQNFQVTESNLLPLMTEKTKAIILNTPNNPTGSVLSKESLSVIRKAVTGKPVFVICDDVYRELTYTEGYHSFTEFQELREQILLVQSFSKPYAMTGWRMGYLAGDRSIVERLELLHQFMVVSTPAPFQKACIQALDFDPAELRGTYRKRREYVLRRCQELQLSLSIPEGAFYAFPDIREFGLSSEEFCKRLIREEGLALTPGFCFGGEGFVRISYCYSDEVLAEGFRRLERFIQKLRRSGT